MIYIFRKHNINISPRLLKELVRPFYNIYEIIIKRQTGFCFTNMLNVKLFVQGLGDRVSFDRKLRSYKIINSDEIRYFKHEIQGNLSYQWGMAERSKRLASDYMLDLVPFEDGDTVIDCGANVGDFYRAILQYCNDVNYIGFEPSKNEYECLKKNAHGQKTFNLALWNSNKTIEFYVDSQLANSSVIKPKKFESIEKIIAVPLCEYVDGPVKLLKLEAEGAEPEILLGLGEKIKYIQYITADLGYERGVNEDTTLYDVTNYLCNSGFDLLKINTGRLCALYVNRKFLL